LFSKVLILRSRVKKISGQPFLTFQYCYANISNLKQINLENKHDNLLSKLLILRSRVAFSFENSFKKNRLTEEKKYVQVPGTEE
jgi:hypothetical protein